MGTKKKAQTKPKRRGRPPLETKLDGTFKLRLSGDDRALYERAAAKVGERRGDGSLSLAAWMRETLTQTARAELGDDVD
jgi:hypothetical protein